MRNNYIDDPTNDPASKSVEGVIIVGDDTNDSTDLMLDQSTEILDDESTLLEDTERSVAMARSSCASSGGGRRLTLPESPAAFLKANTRADQVEAATARIEKIHRLMVCALIEDAVDQLAIVSATLGKQAEPHMNTKNRSLIEVLQADQEAKEKIEITDIKQLHTETEYIQQVLEDTVGELRKEGLYTRIEKSIQMYRSRNAEKEEILANDENIQEQIKDMRAELNDLRESEADLKRTELKKIAELKDSLLDTRRRIGSENIFVTRQECVREESARCKLITDEEELGRQVRNIEVEIQQEERVNQEIDSFLREQQEELEIKMHQWEQTYQEDTMDRRTRLNTLQGSKASTVKRLNQQTSKMNEVKKFVEDVREEERRKQEEREMEERRAVASLKIQAWWRGVMVRRCLGVYKKRKDVKAKLMKIQKSKS